MKNVGSFEAKTQLSQLLKDVEELQEEIVISRRGKPVAVLISYKQYEYRKNREKAGNIIEDLRKIRQKNTPNTPVLISELKEMIEEGRKY